MDQAKPQDADPRLLSLEGALFEDRLSRAGLNVTHQAKPPRPAPRPAPLPPVPPEPAEPPEPDEGFPPPRPAMLPWGRCGPIPRERLFPTPPAPTN